MTTKHYLRPPWAARVIGGRAARWFRPSVVSRLSVPGRTTGHRRSVPVALLEHEGADYLVAAYGDTEWSRNLRAAGTGELTRRSGPERFSATEVPVEERPPLIEAYVDRFGRLPNVARTFRALPDPEDHPIFRVTFAASSRT
jgi:deazaflavin-dependent oxidoreductase (nitroreductase family)